jgi:hypothetical protein
MIILNEIHYNELVYLRDLCNFCLF